MYELFCSLAQGNGLPGNDVMKDYKQNVNNYNGSNIAGTYF